MPQLRQNIITLDWVIIATERAKRPDQFGRTVKVEEIIPEFDSSCPFCPGNESTSSVEKYRFEKNGKWSLRTVTNKFPALIEDGDLNSITSGIFNSMNAIGAHDVVIEHPRHNGTLTDFTHEETVSILNAYLRSYKELKKNKLIQSIVIFRNHGKSAGTSLIHPHSQIVATPIVPNQIKERIASAKKYYSKNHECVFCRNLNDETKSGERIICETSHFTAFIPYAALSPFHIWIFPKRHASSFHEITVDEISDLAFNLKTVLAKLKNGLNNPDYNFTIRSAPTQEKSGKFFHWYLALVPRISVAAGFEMGSGMYVSPAIPEESARYLREIDI